MVRLLFTSLALALALTSSATALTTTPTTKPKPTSPLLVTEFLIRDSMIEYVQLYNNGSEALFLPDWELVNTYNAGGSYSYSLPNGYLAPGNYLVLSATESVSGEAVETLLDVEEFTPGDSFWLVSREDVYEPEPVPITSVPQDIRYHRYTSSAGNYTATRTFSKLSNQAATLNADYLYQPRDDFPLAPIEILANARNCSPSEEDIACGDYVKFYNYTQEPVDFSGVRLRIGYQGQSITASNAIVLEGVLGVNEYAVFNVTGAGIPLNLTNSGGFVWIEDMHGVEVYQNTVAEYPNASNKKGKSWALNDDGAWDWAIPNPSGENQIIIPEPKVVKVSSRVPCRADQFRNPETGRCKKIPTATTPKPCLPNQERNPETGRCRKIQTGSSLKPCKPTEYRNPETNRCRSIAGATKSLTPCKPGQVRNPATNRCRSTATAGSTLKPCAPGQERNPATNRCRKIQANNSNPGFEVEAVETAADTIASWWALGGVGSLALGYAGWEWRSEVSRWVRRVRELFASSGK